MAFYHKVKVFICICRLFYKDYSYLYYMRVKTGLSPALALKAVCVGKNAYFRYFKKNMRVKGLN